MLPPKRNNKRAPLLLFLLTNQQSQHVELLLASIASNCNIILQQTQRRKMTSIALLLIGNSYTNRNGLTGILQSFFEEEEEEEEEEEVGSFVERAPNGLRFVDHANDASTPGTQLINYTLLHETIPWNWVFLQEQSQLGGGSRQTQTRQAALFLNKKIVQVNPLAETVFFMPWGQRQGDPENPDFYLDFSTMNVRSKEGYRQYAQDSTTTAPPVDRTYLFSSVGLALQRIYEQDLAQSGTDPAFNTTSNFYKLYVSGGSHPSLEGSYLLDCLCALSDHDET